MKRVLFVLFAALLLMAPVASAGPILSFWGPMTVLVGTVEDPDTSEAVQVPQVFKVDITKFSVSGALVGNGVYEGTGAFVLIGDFGDIEGWALTLSAYTSETNQLFTFPLSQESSPCYSTFYAELNCETGLPGVDGQLTNWLYGFFFDPHTPLISGIGGPLASFGGTGSDIKDPLFASAFHLSFGDYPDFYSLRVDGNGDGITTIYNEPVPEPTSLVLLGTGLAGLVGAARRRRGQK